MMGRRGRLSVIRHSGPGGETRACRVWGISDSNKQQQSRATPLDGLLERGWCEGCLHGALAASEGPGWGDVAVVVAGTGTPCTRASRQRQCVEVIRTASYHETVQLDEARLIRDMTTGGEVVGQRGDME